MLYAFWLDEFCCWLWDGDDVVCSIVLHVWSGRRYWGKWELNTRLLHPSFDMKSIQHFIVNRMMVSLRWSTTSIGTNCPLSIKRTFTTSFSGNKMGQKSQLDHLVNITVYFSKLYVQFMLFDYKIRTNIKTFKEHQFVIFRLRRKSTRW